MLRPVRLSKGDKVGTRGADGRAASCSSLGERVWWGSHREEEQKHRSGQYGGPGLHQGVVSTARGGVKVIPQDSDNRGPVPLGALNHSVALTNNFSEPRSPCLLTV